MRWRTNTAFMKLTQSCVPDTLRQQSSSDQRASRRFGVLPTSECWCHRSRRSLPRSCEPASSCDRSWC